MAAEKITKKTQAKEDLASIEISTMFDFGATLEEMVEKFGEATVFELAASKGVIVIQAELNKIATSKDANGDYLYVDGEVSEDVIADHFSNYVMEYKRGRSAGKSKIEKYIEDIKNMPAEEQEAKRAELMALLGA